MENRLLLTRQVIVIVTLLLTSPSVPALDLETAVETALARDAGLRALANRQDAAAELAVADSALPDPEIVLGAQGVPIDDPLGSDMMTQYMLGIRQRIPPGRSRELAGASRRADGAALGLDYRARRMDIVRQVRLAWVDWVAAARAAAIAEDGLNAFQSLLQLTEARYRSGSGRQRDVDQARLERALMEKRWIDAENDRERAASDLARWTGEAPRETVPPALPEWTINASLQPGLEALSGHPVFQADSTRIEAGQIRADLARQDYRPGWMIEAGYAHQPGSAPLGGELSDKFFGMISIRLPLFTANRQDRRVAAAEAEAAALAHDQNLRLQKWQGRVRRQSTDLRAQEQRLGLLERSVLPEARRTVQSTLQAYRVDRASFDELVRAQLSELEQQLEAIRTHRDLLQAQAELAYLTGEALR